jgi:hypothetical protein
VALAAGDEAVLVDLVGLVEARVDVAADDAVVGDDVALDALVDLRRVLGHRLLGVEDPGQRVVLDVDRVEAAQRGRLVHGDHRRDALALVAHDPVGQRRLVLHEGSVAVLRHVRLGVDGEDAVHRLGRRRVDGDDPRMRQRAAQDLAVDHPGQAHVVRVWRLAGDLLQRVGALQRLADDLVLGRAVVVHLDLPGGGHDRVDDLRVARAAAEVAADRLADLVLGRARVVGQQRLCGHDHARRAVAALRCEVLGERRLDRVQRAVGRQALDGGDLVAGGLDGEDQARVDHRAVEVHGARRALALVARSLGPRQPELVAQHVDQRAVGLDQQVVADAVDVDPQCNLVHRDPPSRAHCRPSSSCPADSSSTTPSSSSRSPKRPKRSSPTHWRAHHS